MRSITLDIDAFEDLPIDLETLKQDLRVSSDALDEVIMSQYLPSAVEWAEGAMRRSIMSRTHRWIIDEFPCGYDQTLYLPRGKVTSVANIVYSVDGEEQTLRGPTSGSPAGTDYQEDLRGHVGRLMPPRGSTWPSADIDVPAPVVVTYTAGWDAEDVPADIKRALTVSVSMELEGDGLINGRQGFDIDFRDKLISAWRTV